MTIAAQLAVFFATDSKILRRKLIPNDDAQLEGLVAPYGESVIMLPLAQPYDDASCRAAIAAATGVTPLTGRCCAVDKSGVVISVCNADPGLDEHPRGQLVASDIAEIGDRFVGGVFLRRYVDVSTSTDTVASTSWLPINELAASLASPQQPLSEH